MLLSQKLKILCGWVEAHFGKLDPRHACEILDWIFENGGQPRPLKTLYFRGRFSEPTLRAALNVFVDRGLLEICHKGTDKRQRIVVKTEKFDQVLAECEHGLFDPERHSSPAFSDDPSSAIVRYLHSPKGFWDAPAHAENGSYGLSVGPLDSTSPKVPAVGE